MTFLQNNCDGGGPHSGLREVRTYPLGGGANLILCQACFARENRFRRDKGDPEKWPQVDFSQSEIYAKESP